MIYKYACGLDLILRLFLLQFSQVELIHFSDIIYNSDCTGDTLWAQLLLRFYPDSFETSLVFWSWSEDMQCHVVWRLVFFRKWYGHNPNFFVTFSQVKLSHFRHYL